jgi:PI-3-kinase-related kinase SMG-1
MEREVASGMLVTRLAESGTHWQRNRESLCSVLLALEHHLQEIATTGERLITLNELIVKTDKQMDIFKDAISTPDHPLISMQDKLSEQNKLAADQKRLVAEVRDKLQEYHDWNIKYNEAFTAIHGAELGTLITHVQQKPLNLGLQAHDPAVEFLESISHTQNIETCDLLEEELLAMLQKRRQILHNALEALHQYRNITAQFHADYLTQSRSFLWESCLGPLLDGPITRASLMKAAEDFDNQLNAGGRSAQLVKAVDSRLRKQTQELHVRCNKLLERSKMLSSVEVSKLEAGVNDASRSLHQFCIDNPEEGPPSLACFIIAALCPLSRRWLFMEQTAQAARERLSDLTSRDGDWFLDELCTMSGNVSQMNGLLQMCIRAMGHDLHSSSVFACAVEAVKAVHRVYMSMQELFNQFQSSVLPEAINNVLMEDEGMLDVLDELSSFRLSSYPDLPLLDALSRLGEDLLQAALKRQQADLMVTAAVEEMRNKLSSLLDEGEENPAKANLNKFLGLLHKCEASTLAMLETVDAIDVPQTWGIVDIIKQTISLMCNTAGLSLTDELLFVHKAQAIVEFCVECKKLLKSFKLELNNPEEHPAGLQQQTPPGTPGRKSLLIPVPSEQSLCLPVRRYISESLICHVLGQPSYSLASLLVSTMKEYLGGNLPPNPVSPIPVEDLCKVVNDYYQQELSMATIQHARGLFSHYDVAWRECDRTNRLQTNLKNAKQSLHRTRGLTTRFQVGSAGQ